MMPCRLQLILSELLTFCVDCLLAFCPSLVHFVLGTMVAWLHFEIIPIYLLLGLNTLFQSWYYPQWCPMSLYIQLSFATTFTIIFCVLSWRRWSHDRVLRSSTYSSFRAQHASSVMILPPVMPYEPEWLFYNNSILLNSWIQCIRTPSKSYIRGKVQTTLVILYSFYYIPF